MTSLDTLPEDRPTGDVNKKGYRRVYHDWKPSVDKTDVVGTMEAIEGMKINILLTILNFFTSYILIYLFIHLFFGFKCVFENTLCI